MADQNYFMVERTNGLESEAVPAEHVRFDSGSAIFTNGVMPNTEFVAAYAAGRWAQVYPLRACGECDACQEEDE